VGRAAAPARQAAAAVLSEKQGRAALRCVRCVEDCRDHPIRRWAGAELTLQASSKARRRTINEGRNYGIMNAERKTVVQGAAATAARCAAPGGRLVL